MAGDPYKHVQKGDPLEIPAQTFNTLMDVARQYRGRVDRQGGERVLPAVLPNAITVTAKNTGSAVERFEIVGLGDWRWGPADNLEAAAAGVIEVDTPATYRNWGVVLEPIAASGYGLVAVDGICLVKLTPRSTAVNAFADVHPSPTGGTREQYRAANRLHGQARILDITDGYHDDYELALVDLRGGPEIVDVVAKTTTLGSAGPITVYAALTQDQEDGDKTVDTSDELSMYLPRPSDGLNVTGAYVAALGHSDAAAYATAGTVRWDKHGQKFLRNSWPERFVVELQEDYDTDTLPDLGTFGDGAVSVKMCSRYTTAIGGGYGTADDVPAGCHTSAASVGGVAFRTVNMESGDTAWLLAPYGQGIPYLDVEPYLDAPYGTIRAFDWGSSPGGTGPCRGWYWCDGSSHADAPDLEDRFIVGIGSSHSYGATGGDATHGSGTNDHSNHATQSINQGAGAAVDVVTGNTHSETDNEPPWYAVAFAIRLPLP